MADTDHEPDRAADMRDLDEYERDRLIFYGVLMGQVIDARTRFPIFRVMVE